MQSVASHTTRFLKNGVLCAALLLGSLAHLVFWKFMVNLVGTILGDGQCGDIWGNILEVHLVRNSSMGWTWRCGRVVLGLAVKTV